MNLSSALIAQAVEAAAAHCGVEPRLLTLPAANRTTQPGAGRAAVLAAAGLIAAGRATRQQAQHALQLGPTRTSPSQILKVNLTAADVAAIAAKLRSASPAVQAPPPTADRPAPARLRPDYADPRRDIDREARIIAARMAGTGPREIARTEKVTIGLVTGVLQRSGKSFPVLARGRKPGSGRTCRPPQAPPPPRPVVAKPAAPRPRPGAKSKAAPVRPASPPPVCAIEPFPDDHAAWAPLPGSTPVRLIDHENGCRWPVTVSGARDPMVCNLRRHGTSPYCERHAWLAASPAIRDTLTRPVETAVQAPRVVRPFSDRELAA